MAATPRLTTSMMQGGGVYDSIIGQTQTPRANEKVLMFLDRIAPSDPVDNVVVWTDDEEPADPRLHMFAPEHRRKGHRPTSVSTENEEILDELAQSELSYPHDEQARKNSGGHKRSGDHRREGSLEGYGSRGWTPQVHNMPISPVQSHPYAMPAARPANINSRPGSRVPSRMGRPSSTQPVPSAQVLPGPVRPASTRPYQAHNIPPPAPEIDFKAPTVEDPDAEHHGPKSLAATDEDLYAPGGTTTPRAQSPPGVPVFARRESNPAPLKSPFKTPAQQMAGSGATPVGLAASVPLPKSRAVSEIGGRPGSRLAFGGRDAYKTPKREPSEVHVRTPTLESQTPVNERVDLGAEPGDDHVHGHVHEIVGEEEDVVDVREEIEASPIDGGESYGHVDDEDIGHHVLEHYDVVDNQTYRSATPKANAVVLSTKEKIPETPGYPETEIVDVENMSEHQLVEHLKTPAMRSDVIDDYAEDVQRALELHHDEDLCVLLQAAEDELQHPVVRKAVRKAIAGRLRKLGLAEDYDAVKKDPRQAAKLAQEAYGSPKSMMAGQLPHDAPEWARRLAESVHELTRQMQASRLGDPSKPRRIKGPGKEGSAVDSDHDSLLPGHAIDERGLHYNPETDAETDGLLHIEPPAAGLVSPGEMLYDEEVYKLRKRNAHGSPRSHATWEIEEEMAPGGRRVSSILGGEETGLPDNFYADSPTKGRGHRRQESNSQTGGIATTHGDNDGTDWVARYSGEQNDGGPPPWLKVNQRLLNWAVIWPASEIENALKSCERGEQVDELALTIWTAQIYKRYVRATMTTYPPQTVDKMFVPPNIADAINNAAYNGRHDEVALMLRDLWVPYGFKGHPKVILALTKHRREENHWVVHRFSLPDASIITYDTYLEKSLPDGRPLGWWFGIRSAFSNENYPPPDQVMQRMIRLHRPLQLQVDNSLAAAAIWRNLIMGSKADRLVDLERLRDLVRQEVKGIKSKKEQGKLSLSSDKVGWPSEPSRAAIEA